ncbi:hypothetical protein [Nitratireductor pacificus]|uniref:Secreted protein n=1 Tax=Nitratireductor pacificus pht-3B TaxID=391937 RepID=K2MF44_9HYPH|nr:hypothetical protein [Nitratireductor pacificus]EKF20736.1 hypothetical protein NA2_00120 [Nitratireductor pacificus pht-3B]
MKHLHTGLFTALVIVGGLALPGSASANGTLPDGHGGAVCKGAGPCLVLELDCKGTYTDATDSNGTVYGKCSQVAKIAPKNVRKTLKLR